MRKYGPEPGLGTARKSGVRILPVARPLRSCVNYWFPHIFSEAVDCANQTGLFADALGVELSTALQTTDHST